MKKTELVYRFICERFVQNDNRFTQSEIAKALGISLSTVNAAIQKLDKISAVRVYTRRFEVIAFDKLILFWATHRNLYKDICYQTRTDLQIREIENSMPANVAFTAYTAYKYVVGEPPADYSQVYAYAAIGGLNAIKKRFPAKTGTPNLIILSADFIMNRLIISDLLPHNSVSIPQMFVDMWNIKNWYSKEFIDKLRAELKI